MGFLSPDLGSEDVILPTFMRRETKQHFQVTVSPKQHPVWVKAPSCSYLSERKQRRSLERKTMLCVPITLFGGADGWNACFWVHFKIGNLYPLCNSFSSSVYPSSHTEYDQDSEWWHLDVWPSGRPSVVNKWRQQNRTKPTRPVSPALWGKVTWGLNYNPGKHRQYSVLVFNIQFPVFPNQFLILCYACPREFIFIA